MPKGADIIGKIQMDLDPHKQMEIIGNETSVDHQRIADDLITAFKEVYDPEIPVDVYELGLIYKVDINDEGHVDITMTLTAPACPAAEIIPAQVEEAALTVAGVTSAKAFITFDPPWTKDNMSDEAKLVLNMF